MTKLTQINLKKNHHTSNNRGLPEHPHINWLHDKSDEPQPPTLSQ
jgi:hypothetical protein